jgi:multimeric flavodoxin WrbA
MSKKIVIVYYSKSGNTKTLAKRIYDIFREFLPENFSIILYDASELNFASIKDASAFIIGSPDYFDYMSGYIKLFFDEFYEDRESFKGKPAFVFLTHGGGGKAGKKIVALCEALNFSMITPGISVKDRKITPKIESQIQKNCLAMVKLLTS